MLRVKQPEIQCYTVKKHLKMDLFDYSIDDINTNRITDGTMEFVLSLYPTH